MFFLLLVSVFWVAPAGYTVVVLGYNRARSWLRDPLEAKKRQEKINRNNHSHRLLEVEGRVAHVC